MTIVRDPKLHAAIRKMSERLKAMPWVKDHYEWVSHDRKVTLRDQCEPSYTALTTTMVYVLNGDGWTATWTCYSRMVGKAVLRDPITFEGDRRHFDHDCVLMALGAE